MNTIEENIEIAKIVGGEDWMNISITQEQKPNILTIRE